MNLTRLALLPDDKWPLRSTVRPSLDWTETDGVHLEEEDREQIRAMVEECKFTATVVMSNFDARVRTGLPPTGFAATWHHDSTFVADAFDHNLFRGVAGISLSNPRPSNHITSAFTDLNALFGDGSPVPLISRTQKGNWVCSLGTFGWVGLYTQQMPKPQFIAVVVAGLDAASWEACRKEMRDELHRKSTVRDAYPRLEFWREVARKNRSRILATFVRIYGDKPHAVGRITETTVNYDVRCVGRAEDGLKWFKVPTVRVPAWFVFPASVPRGCDDPMPAEPRMGVVADLMRTESAPWEVTPDFDVVIDDWVPYGETEYVRLAGCCDSKAAARVVLRGPQDEILLTESAGVAKPDTLNACVAQATQRPMVVATSTASSSADSAMTCTWEDAALTTNRLVESVWTFHTPVETAAYSQRLMPMYVRVSCRDSFGRAYPDSVLKQNRLASLAVDEWEPILR